MARNIIRKKRLKGLKIIIIILSLLVLIIATWTLICKNFVYPKKYMDTINEISEQKNVDPHLILSVIKAESNFNEKAVSRKDAIGLMQLIPSTANDINLKSNLLDLNENIDLYDTKTNIILGTSYLKLLIDKYNGNFYLAICAYNAGMGNVDKWISTNIINNDFSDFKDNNIPFKETKNYLKKVINNYNMYNFLY